VSLLPQFALPYLRSSILFSALFLLARLLHRETLTAAAKGSMPYQRGQFWIRRFRRQRFRCKMHEALRQRIGVQYHLEGLTREELDTYLTHQLKAAGVSQPLFDDTARQGLYQATKGIPRKVNKLALTALRLAASRKMQLVNEALLLDATSEALL
jgi:hypothetical protein